MQDVTLSVAKQMMPATEHLMLVEGMDACCCSSRSSTNPLRVPRNRGIGWGLEPYSQYGSARQLKVEATGKHRNMPGFEGQRPETAGLRGRACVPKLVRPRLYPVPPVEPQVQTRAVLPQAI